MPYPFSNSALAWKFWLPAWLLVSTFFIALLLFFFPGATWLLYCKDAAIVLFITMHFGAWLTALRRFPEWVFILAAMLLAHFFLSHAPVLARFASLRQIVIPFFLITVGMVITERQQEEEQLKQWIIKATRFLVITGVIFYIVPFWKLFSMEPYLNAKHLAINPNGVPYMFFDPFLGSFPRMVSTILDPINLGHLLVFSLVIGYYEKKERKLWLAVFLLALLASFCKGAFLQLFIILLLMEGRNLPRWIFYVSWLAVIAGLVVAARVHPGVMIHLEGVLAALKTASWWGHGLGMAGNQAAMYGHPATSDIGDTFLGAILGQIGIIGLLLWSLPFIWVIRQTPGRSILHSILISQLVIAALSENAFNLLSILFLMLALGAALNSSMKYEPDSSHN